MLNKRLLEGAIKLHHGIWLKTGNEDNYRIFNALVWKLANMLPIKIEFSMKEDYRNSFKKWHRLSTI